MSNIGKRNQVQGSKDVDWCKLCQSCAAKKAIILFSSCSPFVEEDIHGCADHKCVNFCDPANEGRVQDSPSNELSESQLMILAHLHFNERKETEKLKQHLAIPFERMNQDQRSLVMEEIDKFHQEVCKHLEEE